MGKCLLAFSMNLGSCSITHAEMRGAIEGLRRTWDAGYRKVILRVDLLTAISLLLNKDDTLHQHGMEMGQFQELVDRDSTVQLKDTFREGNHTADYLVSIGYDYPFGSHAILCSKCNLGFFLRYDCMDISEPR
ncbi:Putative ribonuclease H protein At1g65750 [Linum perenne]